MALKLDDLLVKKKEPVQILDLSKSTANNKEELKKLLEKVPEYKIKMDKIRSEDVKVHDKKFSFKTCKREEKTKLFPFANPVPSEMKSLRLEDLCSVNIQWKMLTSLRPKSKLDEEYFSKLIELGKLQLQAREKERKRPFTSYVKKSKNKAGILETKIISCRHCGEEFCIGETCKIFAYDSYERSGNLLTTGEELANQENAKKDKKKRKVKKKKSTKKKIPSRGKKSKPKQTPQQSTSKTGKPSSAPTKKHKPSVTANKIKKPPPSVLKARNKAQKTISNSSSKKKPSKEQSEKNNEKPDKKSEKEKPKKKSLKPKKKK